MPLYIALFAQGVWGAADTQELEGDQGLIVEMCRRSPHASLATISHRNAIKKKLGVGGNGVGGAIHRTLAGSNRIRANGEALVEQLVRETDTSNLHGVAADYGRWDPPPPRPGVRLGAHMKKQLHGLFPLDAEGDPKSLAWAAPYVTTFLSVAEASQDNCLIFGAAAHGQDAFLVSNIFKTSMLLIHCILDYSEASAYLLLKIQKPLLAASALKIFARRYPACRAGCTAPVLWAPLSWDQRVSRTARVIVESAQTLTTMSWTVFDDIRPPPAKRRRGGDEHDGGGGDDGGPDGDNGDGLEVDELGNDLEEIMNLDENRAAEMMQDENDIGEEEHDGCET
jgi:hypothetical protein